MRRSLARCLWLILLAAPICFAQGMLPAAIPGWKTTSSVTATSASLEQIGGATALVMKEYGATAAEGTTYSRVGSNAESFHVAAFTFQDTSGAYGAYSFLRSPEMRKASYSDHSEKSSTHVLILVGNILLDVTGNDLQRYDSAIRLVTKQAASHAQQGVYPFLPMQLPPKGLIPRSDRYFLGPTALANFWDAKGASGDWLGFSRGAEAEVAKYRVQNHELTLLLADYPTPQIAASQLDKLSGELDIRVHGEAEKGENTGRSRTKLYGRRDETLVALVAGATSLAEADAVLDQIRSGVIVTWNEPASGLNAPTMADIVVGTIIGTGEMCLIAILIGVVFSGIRLVIKRILPGRVFDRPQEMEILQLGLSSKPIKAKDFY
jgi:hypothetical protein